MQAQTAYPQRSFGLATLALAVMLTVGAIGGYEVRAFTFDGQAAQAAASDTRTTTLIPRSAREDDAVTVPANGLIPRVLREGPERSDGTR